MSHERLFHNAGKQTFKLSIISVPYPLFLPICWIIRNLVHFSVGYDECVSKKFTPCLNSKFELGVWSDGKINVAYIHIIHTGNIFMHSNAPRSNRMRLELMVLGFLNAKAGKKLVALCAPKISAVDTFGAFRNGWMTRIHYIDKCCGTILQFSLCYHLKNRSPFSVAFKLNVDT